MNALALPATPEAPFVRTDFADNAKWEALLATIAEPSEDGFVAFVTPVTESRFEGVEPPILARLADLGDHAVVFVADARTFAHPDRPILCVEAVDPFRSFRSAPSALWSVENNLSIANMDLEDFAENVGEDGVFRGF